jgi:glycosyltransferase involved in cell wall biosynthesis
MKDALPPMKILHLDSGRDWRGGQQQLRYLLNYLNEKHCETAVVCRAASPLQDNLHSAGIPFFPWLAAGEWPVQSLFRLDQIITDFDPDIIHCHDARSILPGLLSGHHRQKTVIAHRRVDFPVSRMATILKYRPLDAVIAVSQKIKDILSARGVNGTKISVVQDGIDLKRFKTPAVEKQMRGELDIPVNAIHVGSAGSLVDHKGQVYLLEAAARLIPSFPELYFSIAGEGSLRASLQKKIAELNIADRFKLPGFITDMPSYYHSLDIYAHPSKLEGMGSAIIEAMACGLPVLAAASGGIPEIVRDHGILVESCSSEALATGLRTLLQSPSTRTSLAAQSMSHARKFDYRVTNTGLFTVYEQLLAK